MTHRIKYSMIALIILSGVHCAATAVFSETTVSVDAIEIETKAVYRLGPGDTQKIGEAIALFEAKRNAVRSAAKYLDQKGLILVNEQKRKEIYYLATNEIRVKETKGEWQMTPEGKIFTIRVRCEVDPVTFIHAEIKDLSMEKEEARARMREELEPAISSALAPAVDIARAYRYFRKGLWRVGMIYLDRLAVKYPNWWEIYAAKAKGYYALHQTADMRLSLEKACRLDDREACEEMKQIKRLHDQDFHLFNWRYDRP